jgi:hypothetical protein
MIWTIELKQRGGKWAPQCEFNDLDALSAAWLRMQRLKRKLRCVQVDARGRAIIARWASKRDLARAGSRGPNRSILREVKIT